MATQTGPEFYCAHSAHTEPGKYTKELARLPNDLLTLCQIVQGVLVHISWADKYGLTDKTTLDRTTQPVEERLKLILEACPVALSQARPPTARSPGTCRDFALVLCSMLRQHHIPTRIRCGFATYLAPGRLEDHWICEYWKPEEQRWAVADAQLNQLHKERLSIMFDTTDVPSGEFLNAGKAWLAFRKGEMAGETFGHGEYSGDWFLRINVVRDLLALHNQEVSAWDSWRGATPESKTLDDGALGMCDRIAHATENTLGVPTGFDEILDSLRTPPWHRKSGFRLPPE